MDNKIEDKELFIEDKDYWRIYNQGHAKGFITGMHVMLAICFVIGIVSVYFMTEK